MARARSLGVTDDALERLGRAGVDFKLLDEAMAGATAVVRSGFVDWRAAEGIVRSNFGGAAKGFKTIPGAKGTKGYRFVDAFDETLAIAREAKTGLARLTPFVQEQIRKDVLLRSERSWSKVEWHFFPSSRSRHARPDQGADGRAERERDRLGDTSPLMPPVDYSELSDEEAQRRFDELTSSSPERVAWLRREVGDVLDLTPESLVPLWEWFVRREGARSDRGGELPAWYEPDPPELASQRLSPATLRDVDAMAHYLAEVFLHNVPGAAWGIGKLPKRMKYAHQNKPVVKLDGRPGRESGRDRLRERRAGRPDGRRIGAGHAPCGLPRLGSGMSYDLSVLGPLDEARAAELLAGAGAEGDGDELHLEHDGVAATFLIRGGEVGVGVTTLTDDDGVRPRRLPPDSRPRARARGGARRTRLRPAGRSCARGPTTPRRR